MPPDRAATPKERALDNARRYFENSVLILGFLGGVSLAALVLVLTEKMAIITDETIFFVSGETYFQALVWVLAMVSAICVMGCFMAQRALAGFLEEGSLAWDFGYWISNVSFLAFLLTLPMVIWPFASEAASLVVLAGVIVAAIALCLPKTRKVNERTSK